MAIVVGWVVGLGVAAVVEAGMDMGSGLGPGEVAAVLTPFQLCV